jgi:hypothetical protein
LIFCQTVSGYDVSMAYQFMTARRYLAPHAGTFWEWRDGGEVIAWRNGGTIAFRAEVERVLDRLAPHGLPPMDALVMFLAACRGAQRLGGGDLVSSDLLPEWWVVGHEDRLYQDIAATLQAIAELPPDVRDTPERKAELAAVVFESAKPAEPPETAATIAHELWRGFGAEMLSDRRDEYAPELLFRLGPIASGFGRVDAMRLVLRQTTGLEQLPVAAEPDEQEPDSFAALLSSLEKDEELGGMIRLTRQLMAALTLPRAVSEQQDLPLGGVSDITNRGSFDRLLISELAQDDLTFTVRVALNEALYLRREAPPNVPPKRRMVLIDSGLRMWGLPRVFATAAAIALAGTRRARDEFAVYRARESHLDHVDLGNRAGLVAHLAALEPSAHPGAALPTFQRLVCDDEGPSCGATVSPASEQSGRPLDNEAILITGEDVLADKSFRQSLAAVDFPLYVVTVHRSGRLRLARRSPKGTKVLREAHYELDRILAPEPRVTPLIDVGVDPSLPAILRLKRFPLLLPHPFDADRTWGEVGNVLCLTHDRRLMHWSQRRFGGRQISDAMPPGKLHWHEFRPGERLSYAVAGRLSQGGLSLLAIDLEERTCRVIPLALQQHNPRAVSGHGGALFVIFPDHIEVFSLEGGLPVQSLVLPTGMTWQRDRFFYLSSSEGRSHHALSFNGRVAVFEKVCDHDLHWSPDQLIGLFDSEQVDGPVGVTRSGQFRYFYDKNPATAANQNRSKSGLLARGLPAQKIYEFGAVSADGRRLVLTSASHSAETSGNWAIDLHSGEVTRTYGNPQAAITSPLLAGLSHRPLRSRFRGIYVDGETLTLVPARGEMHLGITHWPDVPDGAGMRWATRFHPGSFHELYFEWAISPRGAGFRLTTVAWQDGSRAWLDSRGLLHLKSSDPAIPEATLVLADNTISGWCSDGRLWGYEYFTRDVPRTDTRRIYEEVLRPFIVRLR